MRLQVMIITVPAASGALFIHSQTLTEAQGQACFSAWASQLTKQEVTAHVSGRQSAQGGGPQVPGVSLDCVVKGTF